MQLAFGGRFIPNCASASHAPRNLIGCAVSVLKSRGIESILLEQPFRYLQGTHSQYQWHCHTHFLRKCHTVGRTALGSSNFWGLNVLNSIASTSPTVTYDGLDCIVLNVGVSVKCKLYGMYISPESKLYTLRFADGAKPAGTNSRVIQLYLEFAELLPECVEDHPYRCL
jgi:hypothetical protein